MDIMKSRKWKWNGKWKQKLEKEIGNGNGNYSNHWHRALHKISSYCASCLLYMYEVMIISFLRATPVVFFGDLVMCLNSYM